MPPLLPLLLACAPEPAAPLSLTAVTFNTGTTEGLDHDDAPDDGYTQELAAISDAWYGDGLAWLPALDAAAAYFAEADPDVVALQEVFWPGGCAEIPPEHHAGFICESWSEGDPTVAEQILGPDYQIACHPGKPDKCAAVHSRLGRFEGCEGSFCLEGLYGGELEGCGSGARVARGTIHLADGAALSAVDGERLASTITLVSVHGSSGISQEDQDCRARQVEQVFVDLGDGAPGADGSANLVMGDLNTDPGRWVGFDESAARWADFVGDDLGFRWISAVGEDAPGSYGGLADIDHVASDVGSADGGCAIAGLDGPEVLDAVYFDHRPVACALALESGEAE